MLASTAQTQIKLFYFFPSLHLIQNSYRTIRKSITVIFFQNFKANQEENTGEVAQIRGHIFDSDNHKIHHNHIVCGLFMLNK